ncbi:transferase [Lithospermum erythrorhizon]|uniref:Transferase n=1 Tax=Lithospermum erythrorhizon TaxID=34254 RepID=A0AAV3NKY6_LITER
MGSLESVAQTSPLLKRESFNQHLLHNNRSSSFSQQRSTQSNRSRFARLVLFKKIDYLQWICTVAVFFFFVGLFQMFLPGSVMEKSVDFGEKNEVLGGIEDLEFLKGLIGGGGEDVVEKFEALKVLNKFKKEGGDNDSVGSRKVVRFGYRRPKIALVFADLFVDSYQIQMVTVAAALREIGYDIEVWSLEDGPTKAIWNKLVFPHNILKSNYNKKAVNVDWLSYDGILLNSLQAVETLSCLMQEPFRSVPLIWTIHEDALYFRLRQYASSGGDELVNYWKKVFNRATAVVFPNYILPMAYSTCDAGNYYVVPGAPTEICLANHFMDLDADSLQVKMNIGADDFVIILVGSQLMYKGLWLDHALVLQAILPVISTFPRDGDSDPHLKIIILAGDPSSNYSMAVNSIVQNLGYPREIVKHVAVDDDIDTFLSIADIVIYSSFLEEQSFPEILLKSMCFGKPIVAPDLSMIKKYVDHNVNGYVFPKKNAKELTHLISQLISNGKLSPLAQKTAPIGKQTAKSLLVSETVEAYTSLLQNVLRLPSEATKPKAVTEVPSKPKAEWQWHLFEAIRTTGEQNKTLKIGKSLDQIEEQWNQSRKLSTLESAPAESFFYPIWDDQKHIDTADLRKRKEDEELKDRTDQPRGVWEDVYRNARRADRLKNELHERDEGELERTGQPLCIYEPYYGEGVWPFLHRRSLYRGLRLSTRGRRPGSDDVDAPSRLPLLSNGYYRDLLGEYGAFFAIANRIDRVHKNAWIGFQSWRITAKKESLTKVAETSLLDAIQGRRYGDALFFWARMDADPRNELKKDFWSFCDSINAGNCRFAFSEALKKMYGIKTNGSSLPPMPGDGDTWSVMHSWVLPTRSFLEFVMFSRMFVDALDVQFYDDHHQSGHCYLSMTKDKHCYSRVLELLINVWAYHSGRRMVYVNSTSGFMEEQHKLKNRRGHMWLKWFQFNTLKSMDEDLAEEVDTDHPKRRWLWPSTGEVFWKGIYEKEKGMRNKEKEKRKQQSRDKILRIRNRTRQKALGKYVKPPPEEVETLNSTVVSAKLLR